jgi:glutamate/tyrosine decarboxylase-like PLP-dependent enzyme
MRVDALAAAIDADLERGARPLVVVATAGSTATGAVDPMPEIAELCEHHGLWLHVDGAYGGPAVLAEDLRPQLAGIERADSVALDPHKWLYVPFACGCVVLRDLQHLADAFAVEATYIWQDEEVHDRGGLDMVQLGPEFSRGSMALKVWVSLLAHGRRAYGRRISHDAALARYLAERVGEEPDFELMARVGLSVCCFRYAPPDLTDPAELDHLNERLMTAIQADGRVYCSNAVLGARFALRVCIPNFRTEAEHLDLLLDVARELGRALVGARAA